MFKWILVSMLVVPFSVGCKKKTEEVASPAGRRNRQTQKQPVPRTSNPPTQSPPAESPGNDPGKTPVRGPAKSPAKSPTKGPKKPPKAVAPMPKGLTKISNQEYHVSNSLFDRWKSNPSLLGRANPVARGMQLAGVRQAHAYHAGMRNKDIITEVNGYSLKNTAQLLIAYNALRNKKDFTVKFLRDGKVLTRRVKIK